MVPRVIVPRVPAALSLGSCGKDEDNLRGKLANLQSKLQYTLMSDQRKSSQNKEGLNDVTAAPFLVFFLLLAAEKKASKIGQL